MINISKKRLVQPVATSQSNHAKQLCIGHVHGTPAPSKGPALAVPSPPAPPSPRYPSPPIQPPSCHSSDDMPSPLPPHPGPIYFRRPAIQPPPPPPPKPSNPFPSSDNIHSIRHSRASNASLGTPVRATRSLHPHTTTPWEVVPDEVLRGIFSAIVSSCVVRGCFDLF